jgi:hypothetical protein
MNLAGLLGGTQHTASDDIPEESYGTSDQAKVYLFILWPQHDPSAPEVSPHSACR